MKNELCQIDIFPEDFEIICLMENIKTLNVRRIFISKNSEIYITKNGKIR